MLHKCKTLGHYQLECLDGSLGHVRDFYFDDERWTIRYLVADTGNWLRGRQVLISPHSLEQAIKEDKRIAVNLTKRQIEESPSLTTDQPISRQFEERYAMHFGWGGYWGGPLAWGAFPFPGAVPVMAPEPPQVAPPEETAAAEEFGDRHLRSTEEVTDYGIQASDGEIGHVHDFVLDDTSWAIRYLIIDTSNWWIGKKVLISPDWIDEVSWAESKIFVDLTREAIQDAPEYSEEALITRDYEADLHGHYRREPYWAGVDDEG